MYCIVFCIIYSYIRDTNIDTYILKNNCLNSIYITQCSQSCQWFKDKHDLRNCLSMISRDFNWDRKKSSYILRVVTMHALKEKNIDDMKDSTSLAYFEYLKANIKIVDKFDTPTEFCQIYIKYIMPPTDVNFYTKVNECLDDLAEYFPCTGQGLFGAVLSENVLEIAKYTYTYRKNSDFAHNETIKFDDNGKSITFPPNYAKAYYRKIIPYIKFNDDLLEPKDFCFEIGPPEEKEDVKAAEKIREAKRLKQSYLGTNNNQNAASSSG